MKKLYSTKYFKNKNNKHAEASLKKRLRFKKNKKKRNKIQNARTKPQKRVVNNKNKHFDYFKSKAPGNFSFLTHPIEVIEFISTLKSHFDKKRKVFILMNKIKSIDYSAIVILLSIMVKFKEKKVEFNGDFPSDDNINNILIASGFFQTLFKISFKTRERYNIGTHNAIHTHAWKDVDAELGANIMDNVSKMILGHKVIYKGLQRSLVELMQNSFNHATPTKEGEKHWWLSVNVNEKQKIASFSFIDYGVGIFESLNSKKEGSKFFNWKILMNLFSSENNADVLRKILNGDLHKTVTGKHYRGKGLPGIKEAMDRNLISNLHIITNNVFANVGLDKYELLPNNFEGTFVYFEINAQTSSTPWTELQ
ncbi:hypothetical protein JN11_03941 [Mucilaginibacter frigoritolerans]|uniref:Uncharacterized protein n=1 Tax=Mucilaginibacter frigoritolerans TaxID=652788 RepID=A0A562TUA6_9SPHI|nr:hypothetical protein [Mucilaginibacter frigoritolerans]TWI96828.1 hypothetical protein JN11_03941 [Mucilaginibacter frigoritolerans]